MKYDIFIINILKRSIAIYLTLKKTDLKFINSFKCIFNFQCNIYH